MAGLFAERRAFDIERTPCRNVTSEPSFLPRVSAQSDARGCLLRDVVVVISSYARSDVLRPPSKALQAHWLGRVGHCQVRSNGPEGSVK